MKERFLKNYTFQGCSFIISGNHPTSYPGPSSRSKWRSEKPLAKPLLNYSTNREVFCHVTLDETAFSEFVSSVWQPCLFSAIGNRYSNKTKTFHRVCVSKF